MPVDHRSNDLRIEKLTRQGIALMQEERTLALKGDLAGLEALTTRKDAFLASMEALAETVSEKGPIPVREARKKELGALFDILRRRAEENQYLLRAAASGVKSANRQIEALTRANETLGVYGANGEQVKTNNSSNSTSEYF